MSRSRRTRQDGLRPKLLALSVAACFSLSAAQSLANPTGGSVASGSASFASSGNSLTVTNSANAIINWQGFSIGANEITRFLQSSAASAVLNRVVGSGGVIPQSVIDGVLSSNGRVFLLNQSGVIIGSTARIDVAGLVVSSLNLSDDDFLNGRLRFTEVPGAGGVSNAGVIDAASGGQVFLVAPDVQNSGIIRSPQGQIVLAAGKSVELISENSPYVSVRITADAEQALNLGSLIADSGRIGMVGALVRNSGVIAANSAVAGANGEIRLVATKDLTLDAGSTTTANGPSGGNIEVSAPVVVQVGDIRADGNTGGRIQIDASNFLQAGTLSASGSAGAGGEISVNAAHVIQTAAAVIAADGSGGDGGSISVNASGAPDGLLFSSANYSATGVRGGDIKLLGHDIVLLGASVDASGVNGGGTILVGGDFHGSNPAVPNAATTGINFSTTLKADATQNGDGGKLVVWSDKDTRFYGTASARGGAQSGNGGFMEISGRENLTMGGFADAGAPKGTPGTLLLDPKNIIIGAAATGGLGSFQLVDPHPGANERFGTQVVVLSNDNVVVTDPNDSFVASLAGAVYLFNSSTGALISALTGSAANDQVGSAPIVQLSVTGNYLIPSPSWTNGGTGTSVGAVTWGSGTLGVSGVVSAANSLVGSTTSDGAWIDFRQLTNGNVVVRMPLWDNATVVDAGAVTWMNGLTGMLADGTAGGAVSASNSLVGSATGDRIGNGFSGITTLSNGNYVVSSPAWGSNSTSSFGGPGAVTWVNGANGKTVNNGPFGAAVSSANSLVGTSPTDYVGSWSITELPVNGNLVIVNAYWNGSAGAATWMNGMTGALTTGAFGGQISSLNSLVGTAANEQAGSNIIALTNGNYLLTDFNYGGGAGAIVFGNGASGVAGNVSATNSLLGSSSTDQIGWAGYSFGITPVPNGNYVVQSPSWNTNAGAVTFGNGITGTVGLVSASNSLIGSTSGTGTFGPQDRVGLSPVTLLPGSNSNYVVNSYAWTQPGAAAPAVAHVGAVTWVNGTNGNIAGSASPGGAVSASNSLVGTTTNDQVGSYGIVPLLSNGNYVVLSPSWNNAAATATAAGAVTWVNGTTGNIAGSASPGGAVSALNSLVGTTMNDQIGSHLIMPLINGNYVVVSPYWNNTAANAAAAGAVTFGNGTTGVVGPVSATNSLVGTMPNDAVGSGFVMPLFNGNYVVASPNWNNVAATATAAGAVTFGNGTTGVVGPVSATNSLVGTTTNDQVGSFGIVPIFDVSLLTGNYIVISPNWNNGATAAAVGAVTFGSGTAGVSGAVSAANSLVGTTANDRVGSDGVTPLFINGNYVVSSPNWNGGSGAVTFGSGTTGIAGPVSSSNSLIGSTPDNPITLALGDRVGSGGIVELVSGNYLVASPQWNNSVAGATNAGAVTWVNGTNGNVFGQASPGALVSASNSLVGGTSNDQVGLSFCDCSGFHGIADLPNGNFVVVNPDWTNPVTGATGAGAVTFGSGTAGIAGLVSSTNSIVGSSLNDNFGSGGIFPLSNGDFVVSSQNAANGALAAAGLVHVITPGAGAATSASTGQTFASTPGGDVTITPAAIIAITNTGTAVMLQANNDITLNSGSNIVTSASGAGGSLTLQAGRSILLNSNITTVNGAVTIVANESTANGVVDANRDAGAAVITQAAGTTINAGNANISLTLSDGAGLTHSTSGDITLAGLTTTGHVLVQNIGPTAGSGIVRAGATQLLTAASAALDANGAGGGMIGTMAAPIRVSVANLAARSQAGGAFFDSPTQGLTIGGAALGGLTGISASGAGDIQVSAAGAVSVTQAVSTGSGAVKLAAGGTLSESAAGLVSTTGALTTSSVGGTSLNGVNAVGTFNATNTASGNVAFTDTANPLTITGISESGGGSVTVNNSGAVNLAGTVSAGAGNVTLVSGGNITSGLSGAYAASGSTVSLTAGGAIASSSAPLQVAATMLNATAATGIAVETNALVPAMVTVNTLQNTGAGDILLNAHGGATTSSLVSDPGGKVTINTFSPLDVKAGIDAGHGILLTTSGTSNDMFLDGVYSYTTGYDFAVSIGQFGKLSIGPNFSGVITHTNFAISDPTSNPVVAQIFGTTTNSATQSASFQPETQGNAGGGDKKDDGKSKKGIATCK
jgi:filamentous hemagglutinin family protein